MGFAAIDFAIHGPRKPGRLLVTDIDPSRLQRAAQLFPPQEAARHGVELQYLNPNERDDQSVEEFVREFTDGDMMDDVFVFYPGEALIQQADSMLGRNGCLNFFAGPTRKDFTAPLNFYDVHYEGHHIVGTSGGNTEDMRISLDLMGRGVLNPAGMVTHVGGLDSAGQTILDLPDIPGGKKLIYTHINMPLTAIDEFGDVAESAKGPLQDVYRELDRLCTAANGLWCAEAEGFLLSCDALKLATD
jgi:threonine dehydrogenase-like Zn-dependent dehydrogenase